MIASFQRSLVLCRTTIRSRATIINWSSWLWVRQFLSVLTFIGVTSHNITPVVRVQTIRFWTRTILVHCNITFYSTFVDSMTFGRESCNRNKTNTPIFVHDNIIYAFVSSVLRFCTVLPTRSALTTERARRWYLGGFVIIINYHRNRSEFANNIVNVQHRLYRTTVPPTDRKQQYYSARTRFHCLGVLNIVCISVDRRTTCVDDVVFKIYDPVVLDTYVALPPPPIENAFFNVIH